MAYWYSFVNALLSTLLVSGLVIIMMMLIESLHLSVRGTFAGWLHRNRFGQVVMSALLGLIPGCMGGFAAVSLYTHGLLGFGALVAMMIASSGDEAFVLMAMAPGDAFWLFLLLFVIALVCGGLLELIPAIRRRHPLCTDIEELPASEKILTRNRKLRHWFWQRSLLAVALFVFMVALLGGFLEPAGHLPASDLSAINSFWLDEEWMYWVFGLFMVLLLLVVLFGKDQFVRQRLWQHVVVKHYPALFAWTFGVLFLINVGQQFVDLTAWVSNNVAIMVLLAALIGLIPESGPHLLFVTLYVGGIVPLPVLLASSVSQDGHASLPLLAESKLDFLRAKLVNLAVGLVAGYAAMLFV
ncbi:MAG: arsenic efflux protein [Paludibacteraceae bacterium]|nr:arsenic efflux protein [Paludibacteraceae bacterium]